MRMPSDRGRVPLGLRHLRLELGVAPVRHQVEGASEPSELLSVHDQRGVRVARRRDGQGVPILVDAGAPGAFDARSGPIVGEVRRVVRRLFHVEHPAAS